MLSLASSGKKFSLNWGCSTYRCNQVLLVRQYCLKAAVNTGRQCTNQWFNSSVSSLFKLRFDTHDCRDDIADVGGCLVSPCSKFIAKTIGFITVAYVVRNCISASVIGSCFSVLWHYFTLSRPMEITRWTALKSDNEQVQVGLMKVLPVISSTISFIFGLKSSYKVFNYCS